MDAFPAVNLCPVLQPRGLLSQVGVPTCVNLLIRAEIVTVNAKQHYCTIYSCRLDRFLCDWRSRARKYARRCASRSGTFWKIQQVITRKCCFALRSVRVGDGQTRFDVCKPVGTIVEVHHRIRRGDCRLGTHCGGHCLGHWGALLEPRTCVAMSYRGRTAHTLSAELMTDSSCSRAFRWQAVPVTAKKQPLDSHTLFTSSV